LQPPPYAAGGTGVDNHAGLKMVDKEGAAHRRVDLADTAAQKDHGLFLQCTGLKFIYPQSFGADILHGGTEQDYLVLHGAYNTNHDYLNMFNYSRKERVVKQLF
jgi:hypothetical protein